MSKEFRKKMGFTNAGKMKNYLTSKDIFIPNWELVRARFTRLVDIFTSINEQLPVKYEGDIASDIWLVYNKVKDNDLMSKMKNHGRAAEDVLYTWTLGYMAEKVFTPFITDKLILGTLERNGGDDLSSPDTFKRTGDADLIDRSANVRIDVQCGTGDGVSTIKKHKVDHALKNSGTSYCFLVGLYTGTYAIVKLNDLENETFYENPKWEGQLCWDVPEELFKEYHV